MDHLLLLGQQFATHKQQVEHLHLWENITRDMQSSAWAVLIPHPTQPQKHFCDKYLAEENAATLSIPTLLPSGQGPIAIITRSKSSKLPVWNIWGLLRRNNNIKWSNFRPKIFYFSPFRASVPSPPKLASELQWSDSTNLNTSTTFLYIGFLWPQKCLPQIWNELSARPLLINVWVHRATVAHCQA